MRRPQIRGIGSRTGSGHGALRLALVLLCLLSLPLQGYLTQTHSHAAQERLFAGQHDAGKSGQPANDAVHCLLCHELAAAGAYLLPAPLLLPTQQPLPAAEAVTATTPIAIRAWSHTWRGRGPPSF